MTLRLFQDDLPPIAANGGRKLRRSGNLRTILLFAAAAALGAAGWSGVSSLNACALLYPFIYLQSSRRLDSLTAIFYYAAATWSVLPASNQFFRGGLVGPLVIWLGLIAFSSAPWLALYNQQFLPLSALASLMLLAIPPLGLVTLAHPIVVVGAWFPGTRWFGLGLPLLLIGSYRYLRAPFTLAILLASSMLVHTRFHRPANESDIVPISTALGGAYNAPTIPDTEATEIALQGMVLSHPDSLVLLPESVIPGWNTVREARWAQTFSRLKQQHTGLLLGTTIPIPNTEANRNVLLSRGDTEHLSYVQRVPIPLGMWHPGDDRTGFPLGLKYPATIRVKNRRAAVLMCYEQFLVWPALQSLACNPDMLLAPSNLYWAKGTRIPRIQHVAAQNWADLWAIPLYEARNR